MNLNELSLGVTPSSCLFVQLDFPVPFYITLRNAGDMGPSWVKPHSVRDQILRCIGVPTERTLLLEQTHSQLVAEAPDVYADSQLHGDGIMSDGDWRPDGSSPWAAGVTVADCMPIGVYEHSSGSWAVLHSGRQGTGILQTAVNAIRRHIGCRGNFSVTFGPCISAANYQVDYATAVDYAARWGEKTLLKQNDTMAVDLRAANIALADTLGINNVTVYTDCTFNDPRLGSYRAEGKKHFRRMLALITRD